MIPFLLAGILVTALLVKEVREFILLTTNHVETEATFVDRREDDSGDGTQYYVTFSFVVGDRVYTVEHEVRRIVYETVDDSPFTARYARSDPAVASIEAPSAGRALGLAAFILAWDTAVLAIAGRAACRLYTRRLVAREGVWLQGEVVHADAQVDGDGDLVLELVTRFRSIDTGAWIEVHDKEVRNDLKSETLPPPGTPVHVLYRDDRNYLVL
ncbi:MAG: hypothetical protein JXA93_09110 [Anaerolineae bacterium]|nr:hypothetical protein [Anaerolineae bacterium]